MVLEIGEINKYNKAQAYPSVDITFTGNKRSLVDRVSGNAAQFTRNTIGTYVGADGLIKTAAAGEPRYTYDPTTGEELGLLVEESRTNYLTNSSALHTWPTILSPIVTANATSAPDGTITATSLVPASGQQNQIFLPNFDNKRNLSVFAKADGYDHIILVAQSNPSTSAGVLFSLSGSGNVVATNYGATGSIQQLANGWYRCTMTRSSTDTATMNTFIIRAADSSTPSGSYWAQSSFLGDGTSGVYIWGAQLEEGSYPTSYIPTTTSTVTRDPDTVTLTNNNIYDKEKFDIINDPFGVSAGSDTLTLLPSASNSSAIKRATVFSPNIAQSKINAFANKTDEFWRWRVTGSSFGLPNFTTDGQVTVDWGDGTVETLTTSDHTFTDGQIYHEIGFRLDSGTYFRPRINANSTHKDKLIAIGPAPESMKIRAQEAFNGCTNLQAFDPTIAANGETNYAYAWQSCSSLKNFPLIDTSGVTNMLRTWRFCSGLENFAKIDTSSVTSLYETWDSCSSLTSFPVIDTSNVTDFSEAWNECSSLTEFPVLDTSKGTSFGGTWQSCSSLTEFPSQIDVSKCSNFSVTWRYCGGLTSFPALDFSSATQFAYTWMSCSSLTSFPTLSTTSLVEQFIGTWYGCGQLTTIPICDYSAGTTFSGAWVNCFNLTTIPANLFDTTGTLAANAFSTAFVNDSLSAQSIENLLVSLVANGATGVTLNMNGGGNANTSTWSTAANNAYLELVNNRGWTITQNGTAPT